MSSKLYIVATPIGNLKDITLRALEILKEVDFVLAEDTRVTKKLLTHYQIDKPLISYHHHSKLSKVEYILNLLRGGKDLALVSDAGTPGISDPGNKLIAKILQSGLGVEIIPIPGASAVSTLASVAGFSMDSFKFLGFLPRKKGKNKALKQILESEQAVIFFESPHRVVKTLKKFQELIGDNHDNYHFVVGRELTKQFEAIYRGTIDEVLSLLLNDKIKGEFTIILYGKG